MAEITINLRADPSGFESGVKAAETAIDEWENTSGDSAEEVAKKLEQVIRTLVKLGTESGKTRVDMVTDLQKFGLSAEQAERSIDAVWDEMGKGPTAARDVQKAAEAYDDVEKSAENAADATKQIGDESSTTGGKFSELGDIARDVLEGDFGSAAESAIGALGSLGAFAGAGGALAGVLAAGAATIVADWISQWGEAAAEIREQIASAYQAAAENGRTFLDAAQVQAAALDIIFDSTKREDAAADAKAIGVDVSTMIRALAGDQDALNTAYQIGVDKQTALRAAKDDLATIDSFELIAADEVVGSLGQQLELHKQNKSAAELALQVEKDIASENSARNSAAKKAIDEHGAALQAYADKAASIPNPVLVPRVDTGPVDRELEALRRRAASIDLTVTVNQRRGRTLLD